MYTRDTVTNSTVHDTEQTHMTILKICSAVHNKIWILRFGPSGNEPLVNLTPFILIKNGFWATQPSEQIL